MSDDVKEWSELELKILEYHYKRYSDAVKLSIDFAKILVTNLLWINAAAIGSLPVVSKFVGLDTTLPADRFELLTSPILIYAAGLLLATMCAFCIYLNFGYIAHVSDQDCGLLLTANQTQHPEFEKNEFIKEKVLKNFESATHNKARYVRRVQWTFYAAFASGFASLAFFCIASFQLFTSLPR